MRMPRAILLMFFLAFALSPLSAQRHGGGGGHVGMRGPAVASRGGYNSAPHHATRGYGGPYRTMVPARRFYPYRSHYGYRAYYGGYYGYPSVPYAYSFYGGLGFSSYYPTYSTPEPSNDYQTEQLSQQLYNLTSEVRELRDQNDDLRDYIERRRQAQLQPEPQAPSQPSQSSASPEAPPTVLIFKDGHRVETSNYAVAGPTLWILTAQRAQKYPVAELNLEETRKVNAERGLEFTLPTH